MKKEKKILNTPDPVGITGTEKILNQMIKFICKIKTPGNVGTGFFCKIPFINKSFLVTNNHVLDEQYFLENKEIKLMLNDEKETKVINIMNKKERNKYFNEKYDIALIELKDKDNIRNFLELDDNLFKDNEHIIYEDKSIYIPQYLNGKNAVVSYGLLKGITKSEIMHTCTTDIGSSGSPILNLETCKVIGIHKGSTHFNSNKGTLLKYPINDFIQSSKMNENVKNDSLNYNLIINEMNSLNIIKSENEQLKSIKPKINFIFEEKTDPPHTTSLIVDYGTSVDDMLKMYIEKINKPELLDQKDKISFVYNLKSFKFGDKTPIETSFKRKMNLVHIQVIYSDV